MNRREFLGGSAVAVPAAATLAGSLAFVEGCSTSWIATAEKDLPVIVDIATTVINVIGASTGNTALTTTAIAAVTTAANVFSAGVKALQDAVSAYQATAGQAELDKVIAALTAVQSAAPSVINALPVGDAALTSVVTAAIGTAISLLAAVESLLPSGTTTTSTAAIKSRVTAPAVARVPVSTRISLPDAGTIKGQFNSVLSVYGFGSNQLK